MGPILRHRHRHRARRPGHGGAQRAPVRGLARGLPPHRPARRVRDVRGVRDGVGVDGHPARQVAPARADAAVAGVGVVAQRPAHLDVLAQRPQRLLAPGSGPHRQPHPARAGRRAGLAAAGRQHRPCRSPTTACAASTTSTSSSSTSRSTCSTSPSRRPTATAPRAPGSGTGRARPRRGRRPTSSSPAPVTCRPRRRWRRPSCCHEHVPDLRFRFVNVVDLMALLPEDDHPHGYTDSQFDDLFTADRHVVFAFHGYPRAVHQLVHGRSNPGRFHVRGFSEQGTTTTPFDMVVLNRMSRFHLAKEVLRRATAPPARVAGPARRCATPGWPSTRPTSASTSPTCPTSATGRGAGSTGERRSTSRAPRRGRASRPSPWGWSHQLARRHRRVGVFRPVVRAGPHARRAARASSWPEAPQRPARPSAATASPTTALHADPEPRLGTVVDRFHEVARGHDVRPRRRLRLHRRRGTDGVLDERPDRREPRHPDGARRAGPPAATPRDVAASAAVSVEAARRRSTPTWPESS